MIEPKEANWYKAELYSEPTITYLVAAGSYEAVKKSFGYLHDRYKISLMDIDSMTEFFKRGVVVLAVKNSIRGVDIVFLRDDENCLLRIIL